MAGLSGMLTSTVISMLTSTADGVTQYPPQQSVPWLQLTPSVAQGGSEKKPRMLSEVGSWPGKRKGGWLGSIRSVGLPFSPPDTI